MEKWPKDQQGRLSKVFTFKNYRKSFAFVSQVAMLAEKKNHHPRDYFRLWQGNHILDLP